MVKLHCVGGLNNGRGYPLFLSQSHSAVIASKLLRRVRPQWLGLLSSVLVLWLFALVAC